MEENKFRAWDRWQQKFHYSDAYQTMELFFRFYETINRKTEMRDGKPKLELMQYTGLKDKNGKEAYHKDIVRRCDSLYIIEWHDNLAGWYLKPVCGGWHGLTRSDMALMCEIIGNIYEGEK